MDEILIGFSGGTVSISKESFDLLLGRSYIKKLTVYKNALTQKRISFANLKMLAEKAAVPYPFFFAPKSILDFQMANKIKDRAAKLPSKDEMSLNFRGKFDLSDLESILQELGNRQEILKKRILPATPLNLYVGSLAKDFKTGASSVQIAEKVRSYFGLDLAHIHTLRKAEVLDYIRTQIESKGIFVSFSSHNFMPQQIRKDTDLSGICIKDTKFPFIFIHTRDGDEKPKILESEGRQIFTLLAMLVCIGANLFVLSTKKGLFKQGAYKKIYSVVGEILIPSAELEGVEIGSLDDIKAIADYFKVTPSMATVRLFDVGVISRKDEQKYLEQLRKEILVIPPKPRRAPGPVTGFGKYNGRRFSKEVLDAHASGAIHDHEARSILFRQRIVGEKIFDDYIKKFR